jgi:hypothetical protein
MTSDFSSLGHIEDLRRVDVAEPIERAHYVSRGKHLLIGQRRQRGSTNALIYLGKCIEQTKISNKYDANVWLDIRRPHVVYICGKRGTGKSYDLGILTEGLVFGKDSKITTKNSAITTIIFDTQNQFWSLKTNPSGGIQEDVEQLIELKKWRLEPRAVQNVSLLKPKGEPSDIPDVQDFTIDPIDLELEDWCGLLGQERYTPMGQCLSNLLKKVVREGYTVRVAGAGRGTERRIEPRKDFEIADLIACLQDDIELGDQVQKQTRDAVLWRLSSLEDSNLFEKGGISIRDILQPELLTIFLLRNLNNETKALVVSVFAKKIFRLMGDYHTKQKVASRFGKEIPVEYSGLPSGVWIIVDEAQLICPADAYTAAKSALVEYVKRGRDAGLSLVLATQQPSAVDTRVVSQVDLMIVHRLVVESDIVAALSRLPATFPSAVHLGTQKITDSHALVRILDTREAWIGDAETSRTFLVAMRPRVTAHGGDEPEMV